MVLVGVATPLWLPDVVAGTLLPVASWKARHNGWGLICPLGQPYDVSLSQGRVILKFRSGTLLFQSIKQIAQSRGEWFAMILKVGEESLVSEL